MFACRDDGGCAKGLRADAYIVDGVILARIGNEPPNVLYPRNLRAAPAS
jgi:hypothetical protein